MLHTRNKHHLGSHFEIVDCAYTCLVIQRINSGLNLTKKKYNKMKKIYTKKKIKINIIFYLVFNTIPQKKIQKIFI